MKGSIHINGRAIKAGEQTVVNLNIARLASGTEIDLPIYIFRSQHKGPTLLLSGGLHGDEVNGVEIVRRLIESKVLQNLQKGSVIAVPIMNIYGFLNFSREVPDGKDINRYFPGNHIGSLASRLAFNLTKKVITEIDIGIDFHTGGASRFNFPQIRFAPEDKKAEELAMAFKAPILMHSKLIDKSLRKQAHKMDKSIIVYEGGESMRFDEEVIKQGINGARRVMKHLGMVKDAPEPSSLPVLCHSSSWLRSKRSGLFTSVVKSGSMVEKRQLLGYITDPFGQFKTKITSHITGFIIGHNNMPVVNQGDALFHIGSY